MVSYELNSCTSLIRQMGLCLCVCIVRIVCFFSHLAVTFFSLYENQVLAFSEKKAYHILFNVFSARAHATIIQGKNIQNILKCKVCFI